MNKRSAYPRTDVRHWKEKLVTRGSDELHVRICFGGVQRWWPLKTVNREDAAEKARAIWRSLNAVGMEPTLAKYKPWTVEQKTEESEVTVGSFLKAVTAVAAVRPTTLTHYTRKFRFLVAGIAKVKGSKKRHDYVHGGAAAWRQRVDATPLSVLTPESVSQWRVKYIKRFDSEPLKRQQAQQTTISILRNAKSLFAKKVINNIGLKLPSPLPFDGVDFGKRPKTRYKSKIDAAALVQAAHNELKTQHPEQFKIFLLAFGAGLRRGEIDRLTWKAFNWDRNTLSIEANEYGVNKTDASNEEIDLGEDMVAFFKSAMASGKGDFVIESKAAKTAAPHWNRYRCDGHFKDLLEWLRKKNVTARNPLHTLRKEFGRLSNHKFGIFAASAALRHSNITITRDTYLDKKERTAINLSDLLKTEAA